MWLLGAGCAAAADPDPLSTVTSSSPIAVPQLGRASEENAKR